MAEVTTAEAFAAALEATLGDAPENAGLRRNAVQEESWAARAADAARLIDALP
jgi:hypothetical protein